MRLPQAVRELPALATLQRQLLSSSDASVSEPHTVRSPRSEDDALRPQGRQLARRQTDFSENVVGVLAQSGRWGSNPPGGVTEPDRRVERAQPAGARMLLLEEHAAG